MFLHQANLARDAAARDQERGNLKGAIAEHEREKGYLERYLMARANDLEVRERLVRLMCQDREG